MIGAELQEGIYTALTAGSPVVAGGRVYDQVPSSPTFPYVTIGNEQVIDDGNSCEDGWLVYPDVHIWDRPVESSKAALKGIIAEIVPLITSMTSITGFDVIVSELESSRSLRDQDGLTEHAILTFRIILNPT